MRAGVIMLRLSPAILWRTRIPRYRLVGRECKNCGRRHYPPRPVCPYCGSRELVDVELPRTGTVETYTVIHSVMEGFRDRAPHVLALVRPDDGTRVLAPLTDIDPGEARTGMRVEAVLRRIRVDGDTGLIGYGLSFRPLFVERRGGAEEATG
jgi:uncharacterized OB-fold protein